MKTITHICLIATATIALTTSGFAQGSQNSQQTANTHHTRIITVVNPVAAVMVRNAAVQKAASEKAKANKTENKNPLDNPSSDFIAINSEEKKLSHNTSVNKK